jgi:hypothetical protein
MCGSPRPGWGIVDSRHIIYSCQRDPGNHLQKSPSRRRPSNDFSKKNTTQNELDAKADLAHCDATIIIIVDDE